MKILAGRLHVDLSLKIKRIGPITPISEIFNLKSLKVLPNLFRSECANAIQAEAEHNPIFLSQTDIECRKLCRDGTTVPGVAECYCGTDQ